MPLSPPLPPLVQRLLDRGVLLPDPSAVFVDADVDPERIAPGVALHPGSRLRGAGLSIGPDCVIGGEGPATVEDCALGHGVELKGGFFSGAVFLDRASMGSGAHIRPGTLLEEEASGAHTVGLKQTILLPYVTLGSLVNFCDCLMAGGTSRRNHSEVGSSFIHFNFTPSQDKATASLFGDVPRGVLLDQPPIFLGGQGGVVGPTRIEFGCVLPAGAILRKDCLEGGRLILEGTALPRGTNRPYEPSAYRNIERIVRNNLAYVGNLRALREWYCHARRPAAGDPWTLACVEAAIALLDEAVAERVKRLGEVVGRLEQAAERVGDGALAERQRQFGRTWPGLAERLLAPPPQDLGAQPRDRFIATWKACGGSAVERVQALGSESRALAREWLESVVEDGGTEACLNAVA